MNSYVLLLRGINVGGRIIKMSDLKQCLDGIGLLNVKTVLQTGNVVFESEMKGPELKEKIEATLSKTFNYPSKTQVLSSYKLAEVIKKYPFKAEEGFHSYVIFLENGLEKDLVDEPVDLNPAAEKREVGPGVVYWQVERGQTLKSPFAKLLTKSKYKDFNTNRNLNTLKKLIY